MKYYRDAGNQVFAFESDGSQDGFIPGDLIAISAEEADTIRQAAMPTIQITTVTMRQARLALLQAGKLGSVGAAIAALPSPQKEAAQIEWEYSQVVERHRPFVLALAPALGLSDAQLDDLFNLAATL